MRPSRKRGLIILSGLLFVAIVSVGIYGRSIDRQPAPDVHKPSLQSSPIELERRGERWFLVDLDRNLRSDGSGRYLNPMVLDREELINQAERRWGEHNPWLAFRTLYHHYYTPYYQTRFDRQLQPSDREIRDAYEYWKQRQSP